MSQRTTDLHDAHGPDVQVLHLPLRNFGGRVEFGGLVQTVIAPEDNTHVRATLEQPGEGRVLVVDGLGSLRCALLGDNIGELAVQNGWAGVVVNGCVRDAAELAAMNLGVRAIATSPVKSGKRGWGVVGEAVTFGGVRFEPGHHLYADADGLILSPRPISAE